MNSPDKIYLAVTRHQLKQWAYWCNDILTNRLGHSRKNILVPLIESKGDLIKSTRAALVPDNEHAERVDELINQYAIKYAAHVHVLKLHYLQKLPLKKKLETAKLSQTTYFRYLTKAENWITEQLFSDRHT